MTACKFFRAGRCAYGVRCRNVHEGTEPAVRASAIPCKYFAQGLCSFGIACHFSHDLSTSESENWETDSADPISLTVLYNDESRKANRPFCMFFPNGKCKNGDACRFLHVKDPVDSQGLTQSLGNLSLKETVTRDYQGTTAAFREGAEVASIALPSDFSSIQLADLPSNAQPDAVIDILALGSPDPGGNGLAFGFEVPLTAVQLKPMKPSGSIATVKFDDPNTAQLVVNTVQKAMSDGEAGELSVTVVKGVTKFGSRLQLSSVSCTWNLPHRKATLCYDEAADVIDAFMHLQSIGKIRGRSIKCFNPVPRAKDGGFAMQVTGLPVNAVEADISTLLPGDFRPLAIKIGEPSYETSGDDTTEAIHAALRAFGQIDYFHRHDIIEGARTVKATASFIHREAAIKAVNKLNNSKEPLLNGCKLSVKRMLSIKYNIPPDLADAIREDLELLNNRGWNGGFVRLRLYAPTTTPYSTIRLSGEEERPVSLAKFAVERLLAGSVILNGPSALWSPWFRSHDGQVFLSATAAAQKLYIRTDARKSQLLIYGGMAAVRQATERDLIDKFQSLKRVGVVHRAVAVDMDVTRSACAVCLCPAHEPFKVDCNHLYCKDCFLAAAEAQILPFKCLGDEGNCKHVFGLKELRSLLPFSTFEALLQSSFHAYIKSRPTLFHFCPTPDCPSLYHPTTVESAESSKIFTCPSCLTDICTCCNVIAHQGITCTDWKDNYVDGGTKAFAEYKKSHGVKDCPNCGAPIEKFEGCMHVQCGSCKAHICWFCLERFKDSDACYTHMTIAHQGIYDPADRGYHAENYEGYGDDSDSDDSDSDDDF